MLPPPFPNSKKVQVTQPPSLSLHIYKMEGKSNLHPMLKERGYILTQHMADDQELLLMLLC